MITDKINQMIADCGLLIGNLTYSNPNVYHEIGFVMGKAKAEGRDSANMLLILDESVDAAGMPQGPRVTNGPLAMAKLSAKS